MDQYLLLPMLLCNNGFENTIYGLPINKSQRKVNQKGIDLYKIGTTIPKY